MLNYPGMEWKLGQILCPRWRPVAIAFADAPPEGIARIEGGEPASCGYWRLAAQGRSFHTVAGDHQNCPIGGYTLNVLQMETMPQLMRTFSFMGDLGYLRVEEIPRVLQLEEGPPVVVYAPLGETPLPPSVVVALGTPGRVMMLAEAATRAGAISTLPLVGHPTCMALAAALAHGAVASTGCIGNRLYTGIGEGEMYFVLRGSDLEAIVAEVDTILAANEELTAYHEERRAALGRCK